MRIYDGVHFFAIVIGGEVNKVRTPAMRAARNQRFLAQWFDNNCANSIDAIRPERCNNWKRRFFTQWDRMNDAFEKECGFFDPDVPNGGPAPSNRRRRSETETEPEIQIETEAELQVETITKTESVTETEPETQPKTESETKTEYTDYIYDTGYGDYDEDYDEDNSMFESSIFDANPDEFLSEVDYDDDNYSDDYIRDFTLMSYILKHLNFYI